MKHKKLFFESLHNCSTKKFFFKNEKLKQVHETKNACLERLNKSSGNKEQKTLKKLTSIIN